MKPVRYYLFETDLGWSGVAGSDARISRLVLPLPDRAEIEKSLRRGLPSGSEEVCTDFSGEVERLKAYFAGKRVDLNCELDFDGAGPFDIAVWNAAREIGYGERQTYGWIADRIGKPGAPRAVGQALGRNPIPVIVPCHRVLRSDGGLGGFSSGLHWKISLLDMEKRAVGETES